MNHLQAVRRQDKAKHISENPLQCTPLLPSAPLSKEPGPRLLHRFETELNHVIFIFQRYRTPPPSSPDETRNISRRFPPPLVTRSRSPRRRTRSPMRRARSPFRQSRSSRERSRSPRRRSNSPRRPPMSSRRRSKSPQKQSNFSQRRSLSPLRPSMSSRRRSKSPRKDSNSPQRCSLSPRQRSRSPRRHSKSPRSQLLQRTDSKQHMKDRESAERVMKQSYSVRDDKSSDKFATVETRGERNSNDEKANECSPTIERISPKEESAGSEQEDKRAFLQGEGRFKHQGISERKTGRRQRSRSFDRRRSSSQESDRNRKSRHHHRRHHHRHHHHRHHPKRDARQSERNIVVTKKDQDSSSD